MEVAIAELTQISPEENQQEHMVTLEVGSAAVAHEAELTLGDEGLPYAELVSESLWQRLTARIEKNENVDNNMARRMMNESLSFLKACADNPGIMLSPSEKVDVGWHTFILYTHDYAEFCENTAGRFIHHEPNDFEAAGGSGSADTLLMTAMDTYRFMAEHGHVVDAELWVSDEAASPQASSSCTTPPPNPPPRPRPICGPGQPPPNYG